jgi:hypothetical protein
MKRTSDHSSYGDTIDGDRLRASPRAIVAGWVVIAILITLSAVPSLFADTQQGIIATARAAYLDLRQSIARAPALPTQLRAEKNCS